jgi:hypothetical protein
MGGGGGGLLKANICYQGGDGGVNEKLTISY